MMCSICYIYEADTISDNNCGAGVYKDRDREMTSGETDPAHKHH